jgi:hypothetical protein
MEILHLRLKPFQLTEHPHPPGFVFPGLVGHRPESALELLRELRSGLVTLLDLLLDGLADLADRLRVVGKPAGGVLYHFPPGLVLDVVAHG